MTLGNTLFPGALDTITELPDVPPTAEQDDAGYEHDLVHKSVAQALRALEAKVGANASAVATSLDNLLANHVHAGRAVGAKVGMTANQSTTNNTDTTLNFPSEFFDTDGFHDTVTNNSRITIPAGKGGKYIVHAAVEWAPNATGGRMVFVLKNGGTVQVAIDAAPTVPAGNVTAQHAVGIVDLSPGDYITVQVRQDSGGALNVMASDTMLEVVALETRSIGAQGSGARAYRSSLLSTVTATNTYPSLDTERYDTDGYHDNVTNPSRFTVPKTGRYTIGATANFANNATGQRQLAILVNHTTLIADNLVSATAANGNRLTTVTTYQLNAGDYVEALVWQNSGGALDLSSIEVWITAEETFTTADPSSAGAKLTHNAQQSIASGVETMLAFNTDIFDTDNYHDTVTNNSRITIPAGKAGRYVFTACVSWASSATGERYIYIRKNGTKPLGIQRVGANPAAQTAIEAVAIDEAVAGDYYEVAVFQTSGAALNVQTAADYTPVFTATALNTQVPTAMNNFVGARAARTAAQSISTSTNTVVVWDAEQIDTSGFRDTTTNPSRFTVPPGMAGTYRVHANIGFAGNATGVRSIQIWKNGSGFAHLELPSPGGATQLQAQLSDVVTLAVGDYIEVVAYQASGGSLNVLGSTAYSYASIQFLGP